MAYIRLPGGIKVALEYEVYGKVVVNIYHVTTTDPIVSIKLIDIAEIFEAWWSTQMRQNFSQDISLHTITAHNLDVPNGEKITLAVSPALPGTDVSIAMTNNVALVATFDTDQTGRSFRGRAYLAGIPRGDIVDNNASAAIVTALLVDYVSLSAALAVGNAAHVVASFQTAGAPRPEGVATQVTAYTMNTRLDTQRRRMPSE